MNIAKDCVVTLNYVLRDDEGNEIDTTEGVEPLEYIHGQNNLISGLERELEGKKAGDELTNILILPADAYGEYIPELAVEVERKNFPDDVELEEGMQFEAEGPHGVQIVTVTKIDGDKITVDGNHPLAGKNLHFDIKILSVREATDEEKKQGLKHSCGCDCGCGCEDDDCDDGCGCGGHDGCGCH